MPRKRSADRYSRGMVLVFVGVALAIGCTVGPVVFGPALDVRALTTISWIFVVVGLYIAVGVLLPNALATQFGAAIAKVVLAVLKELLQDKGSPNEKEQP